MKDAFGPTARRRPSSMIAPGIMGDPLETNVGAWQAPRQFATYQSPAIGVIQRNGGKGEEKKPSWSDRAKEFVAARVEKQTRVLEDARKYREENPFDIEASGWPGSGGDYEDALKYRAQNVRKEKE